MSKSTKAVLLSALVFPGTGHIYLKKYIPASLLLTASLGSLYVIISRTLEMAMQISEKIQRGEIQADVAGLTNLVEKQMASTDTLTQNIATTVIVVCWIVSIVDSYRLGRQQDKDN